MNTANNLSHLPSVDEILRQPEIIALSRCARQQLVIWIRSAVDDCRSEILAGVDFDPAAALRFVLQRTVRRVRAEDGRRQQPVINATGILLHTNLGRAPLAQRAVQRMQESAGYANVEMNLHTGKRNHRGERVCQLLQQLTTAEDAAVVNNCAAATMLVLQAMASGREVIVSRGQLVEIGGGYRLPEVFAASGAILKEVGTTNRTYLRDYENAIGERTGAIIRVHRSNFFQGGFVTEPDIADLVALGKQHNIPVIDDLGSGCIQNLSAYGLQEPTVGQSVAAGADLTLFSGDKLFGGPQAGIIVGKSSHVEMLRRHPMMRALRVDKVTLAAIEATAEIHLSENAAAQLPLLQMLSKSADDVRAIGERALSRLARKSDNVAIDLSECVSEVGGGSVPGSQIPSFGLRIQSTSSDAIAAKLRSGSPSILGRIQDGCVILDLRTVQESQLQPLIDRLVQVLQSETSDEA
ncbi:MAG: L-seryl-tRNA(Sec) selenium transferase [Planctomycetaceae bacterium]